MKAWNTKALELLAASLEPPKHELNELDSKAALDHAVEHCRSSEAETNARVARLYGLTPAEIQLVEEAAKK